MPETLRLNSPDDVVAAVPVLLGFHPKSSVVLILTKGPRLELTIRVDLPEAAASAHQFARHVAGAIPTMLDADRASLVVVGSTAHEDETVALRSVLAERGIEIWLSLWAQGTEPGQIWMCHAACHHGIVADAKATPLGVATAAISGRQILANWEAVLASVAPCADAGTLARRARMLAEAADVQPASLVAAVVDSYEMGHAALDDDTVVSLARAFNNPQVRDHVIRWLTRPAWAEKAHPLWLTLVREIPAPYVADVAVVLALSALLRGDGALTDAALIRAEQADPTHKLTQLVRRVNSLGVSPTQVRALLAQTV